MAGARLQRPAVAHHRLDGGAVDRAGELLAIALHPLDHRDRRFVDREIGVDAHHAAGFLLGFLLGGVRGVPLLPEELGGAQEEPRAHLPAHDVGPLVDQQRQVAIGADPLAVHVPDDGLRGRANDQRLVQLLAAAVRHDRQLRREALDVLGFLLQEAERDEQREVGVDVTGLLEAPVERRLDILPEGVAVGPDDHAALDRGVVGQLGFLNDIGIPARVILAARGDAFFCHDCGSPMRMLSCVRDVLR